MNARQAPLAVTVTPNPSVDILFETETLVWDDANRVPEPRRRAGGQGINVARALRVLGAEAVPVALLGGRTGAEVEGHDWEYLLQALNLLTWDHGLARLAHLIGLLIMTGALGWAALELKRQYHDAREAPPA